MSVTRRIILWCSIAGGVAGILTLVFALVPDRKPEPLECDMSSDNENQRDRLIYGVWYEDHSDIRRGTLVLRRESPGPDDWGRRYDFQEDGSLIDTYSARCGNDAEIHRWSGKWELDRERNLLLMKIEKVDYAGYEKTSNPSKDYKRGRKFCISELTEHRMVLRGSQS
jgi:hypothetical protein